MKQPTHCYDCKKEIQTTEKYYNPEEWRICKLCYLARK